MDIQIINDILNSPQTNGGRETIPAAVIYLLSLFTVFRSRRLIRHE